MTQMLERPAGQSRISTIKASLSRAEWRRMAGMFGFIALLHIVGFGILFAVVVPHHYASFGVLTAITAYTLGMRHAFDADHISAIDNTTRKLMNDGKRPLSVGFWFSLGHSSVVVALSLGLTIAARSVFHQVSNPNSLLKSFGGVVGTLVSGSFLYLIAGINLVILVGIVRMFRNMRKGIYDDDELEGQLQARGFMFRIFGKRTQSITKEWHMYPVGILFGLGFDTATEIALLAATAGAATAGLPWYAILMLPILFTGGMCLLDTIDGSFMNFAYGWAFAKPVRKVYYNIAITGLSIAVAFLIGTIELLGLLATELHLSGPFWDFFANFNINIAGMIIVALFVLTWAGSLLVWRMGRIEEKWTLDALEAEPA
jgi:high-affinity nickel-transport protein